MIEIKKLIETVKSEHWDIVVSTETTLTFTTGRSEYTITKRPLKGYKFTELSIHSGNEAVSIFESPEDLIIYINENKAAWEEKVIPFDLGEA